MFDDLVVAARNMTLINEFKEAMFSRYRVEDLGELQWVLGMAVKRDREHRTMELSQTAYVDQVLDCFGMTDCKPMVTPAVDVLPRIKATGKANALYMQMVGEPDLILRTLPKLWVGT